MKMLQIWSKMHSFQLLKKEEQEPVQPLKVMLLREKQEQLKSLEIPEI